ncbi:CoA-transferase family III domain-containing protein [Aspergillus unguis]
MLSEALFRGVSQKALGRFAASLYSTKKQGVLQGVRILDLTRVLAGPFCTQILADYGADVIKVEHPTGGDDTRHWKEPGEDKIWKGSTTSLYFNGINRNKRSIALDMKHERGKSIILDLVKQVDVVVDNFIPGKLEELGLGFDVFKEVNPAIIHASISGYGATGPYSKRAGYDVIAAAEGGLLHITGEPNGPPIKPGVGLMDMATGLYLHGAICAALVGRSRTGEGQKIDASLFETTLSLLNNVGMSWLNLAREGQRWGTAHASIVPYDSFKTRDSALVLGAVNNRQFRALCQRLGDESIADNPKFVDNDARVRNRDQLKEVLDRLFAQKTSQEWMQVFEGSGLPHGPVNNIEQAFSHPQVADRGMVQTIEHSAAAGGTIQVMGMPVKLNNSQNGHSTPPPGLGEHTEEILAEMGHSDTEIARLREENVIASYNPYK